MALTLAAVATALTLASPVSVHTEEEQVRWLLRQANYTSEETPDLAIVAARQDFMDRHDIKETVRVECPETLASEVDCTWLELVYWPEPEPSPPPTTTEAAAQPPSASPAIEVSAGVEQWRSLVAAYFPADQVDKALAVMACESGGDPTESNPSGAKGLMQVMTPLWSDHYGVSADALYDPETNMWIAGDIYANYGWSHWSCA